MGFGLFVSIFIPMLITMTRAFSFMGGFTQFIIGSLVVYTVALALANLIIGFFPIRLLRGGQVGLVCTTLLGLFWALYAGRIWRGEHSSSTDLWLGILIPIVVFGLLYWFLVKGGWRRALLWPLVGLLFAAGLGCFQLLSAQTGQVVRRPNPTAGTKNILLLTIDTLRQDALGCYGNPWARTPNLDRLAHEGQRFDRAYAHVPMTLPSHTSMLSGVHPPNHGVHLNGQKTLRGSVETLPQRLSAQGYDCAAFVSSFVLDAQFGLKRGFHQYNDPDFSRFKWGVPRHMERMPTARLFKRMGLGTSGYLERPGQETTDLAIEWLRARDESPWFLWLHLFEPHGPHEAPAPMIAHFQTVLEQARDLAGRELRPDNAQLDGLQHILAVQETVGGRVDDVAAYMAEVEIADQQVGRVLALLEELELAGSTVVLVTADHGQAFGEEGYVGHLGSLGNETLAVPAILRMPDREVPADLTLRHVDLLPTLVEAAGLPPALGVEGRSLLSSEAEAATPIYFETLARERGNEARIGVRQDELLLIATPAGEPLRLAADVLWGEGREWGRDIADGDPRAVEMGRFLLEQIAKESGSLDERTNVEQDEATIKALRALGYID